MSGVDGWIFQESKRGGHLFGEIEKDCAFAQRELWTSDIGEGARVTPPPPPPPPPPLPSRLQEQLSLRGGSSFARCRDCRATKGHVVCGEAALQLRSWDLLRRKYNQVNRITGSADPCSHQRDGARRGSTVSLIKKTLTRLSPLDSRRLQSFLDVHAGTRARQLS